MVGKLVKLIGMVIKLERYMLRGLLVFFFVLKVVVGVVG